MQQVYWRKTMAIYQQNDRTNPQWVYDQLTFKDDPSWINACEIRIKKFLNLYLTNQVDAKTLKFNLQNIKGTTHEYATYEEILRKNHLDDLLNPLIESL